MKFTKRNIIVKKHQRIIDEMLVATLRQYAELKKSHPKFSNRIFNVAFFASILSLGFSEGYMVRGEEIKEEKN